MRVTYPGAAAMSAAPQDGGASAAAPMAPSALQKRVKRFTGVLVALQTLSTVMAPGVFSIAALVFFVVAYRVSLGVRARQHAARGA